MSRKKLTINYTYIIISYTTHTDGTKTELKRSQIKIGNYENSLTSVRQKLYPEVVSEEFLMRANCCIITEKYASNLDTAPQNQNTKTIQHKSCFQTPSSVHEYSKKST